MNRERSFSLRGLEMVGVVGVSRASAGLPHRAGHVGMQGVDTPF